MHGKYESKIFTITIHEISQKHLDTEKISKNTLRKMQQNIISIRALCLEVMLDHC